ncbi:PEGA domain-containing protein [Pseudodesulfovibrio sp. zrk46]|uniref:PEGA domain-containing protein n=1 Tax=Pseudodesulfovibrio sp. zrk46 TaxID=2725288 RepID=UPI001449CF45|nr:PEGA domain-containing protein [Pseudodesulfovibrio sp. zrk46]QJB56976.1 PEGA domain-containing protein [Pseudodesulfovibrio sp. zrk46]
MSKQIATLSAITICILLLTGCGVPKQKIPVSTNPLGATVYADGTKVCTTPCAVSLDKQSDHLLTIVKDGYKQEDLEITRQFMPDEAIRDGIISGVLTGGDPKEIGQEVAKEVDEQERSGEAYELRPDIVTITLTPKK